MKMKESVIDVLMYIFEHYIDDDQPAEPDRENLEGYLLEAGFDTQQVGRAFDWLEDLASLEMSGDGTMGANSQRIYTEEEIRKLGHDGIGFMYFLEQNGILNTTTREQIIDRSLALDARPMDMDQLKWVTLMVLFNQPHDDKHTNLAWLEELVYDDQPLSLH
jgi:Smg protein